MKILVIENEKSVASIIKKGLEADSYQVTLSHDGADGLKQASSDEFDLLILDSMLPKKDGLTVLRELREAGKNVPVLMLTDEVTDIVTGLNAGGDACLEKPFVFSELQARVRVLIRRSKQSRGADIRFADLRIDPVDHKVWRGQVEIEVTEKEYRILNYMVKNAAKPLSRADLADNCWDEPFDTFTNIIDVYISYLRKKVDEQFPTKLIHTVRGQGYILKER